MNKGLAAALVGVLGLALGFGAGWLSEKLGDGNGASADSSGEVATSASPSPAASS